MTMPNSSRNLTQTEWEPHRAKITRLHQTPGMTLHKIKKIMLEQDQLDASKSQYETILKHWGLRKNLSVKEWREVLRALDSQRAQDPNYDLYIGGQVISESSIRRNRTRYCKNIAPDHSILDADSLVLHLPEGVTIKQRTMRNEEPTSLQFDANSLPSFDGSYRLLSEAGDNVADPLGNNLVTNRQAEIDSSIFAIELGPDHRHGQLEYSQFSPRLLDVDFPEGDEIPRIYAITDPPFRSPASPLARTLNLNWTWGAPFFEFQTILQSQVLPNPKKSMRTGTLALDGSQNGMSTSPRHVIKESDDVRLAQLLIGDSMSISSRQGHPSETQGLPSGKELLDSLRSLLPTATVEEEFGEPLDLRSGDGIFTSDFDRLFLFSVVNNYAGLENIPVKAIMRFIGQQDHMISSILYYLRSVPTIFSQALAEKLFKAAIEARDPKVIQLLLNTGFVDPNAIVCIDDNKCRRTPIERSATFRHMETTKCLLSAGADVNKTYQGEESGVERGALECAIRKWGQYSPIDLGLVKLLLDHGAIVYGELAGAAIRWGDQNLIAELMSRFDPSHHPYCFRGPMLNDAAMFLHNDLSFKIIQQAVKACQDTHRNQCIDSDPKLCRRVMAQAAKRGNLEVVKLLFAYGGQEGLDHALAAAVRSRSHTLIDFLLVKGANINGEACTIDDRPELITTPLAEAIRSGDDELIARFENSGALSQIEEKGRFEAAMLAVSEIGSAKFFQKLLQMVPNPDGKLLTEPLNAAIKAKNEDFALRLLASGANVGYNSRLGSTLLEALRIRSKPIVSAILECGVKVKYDDLEAAAEWGDLSIVEDLVFMGADINAYYRATALIVAVQRRNMPLVKLLIKLGADLNRRSYRNESPLSAAILTQDSSLIDYLIEHGADPVDGRAITNAMSQDGETHNFLFRRFRERYPSGRKGFGSDVLQYVLQIPSDPLLDLCLGAKFDVNSLRYCKEYGSINALGLVIRKYQGKRLDLVSKLLDAGGDINGPASHQGKKSSPWSFREGPWIIQTAFLEAIQTKSLPLVELLIHRGADIQKEAKLGLKRTPLQKACEVGSYPIVDLLLRHHANVQAPPAVRGGGDALQLAAKAGSVRIANRLLNCGADVNAPTSQVGGHSALGYAAKYGRVDMIKVLWNASGTVFTAEQYDSAISVTQENGHLACVFCFGHFLLLHRVSLILTLNAPVWGTPKEIKPIETVAMRTVETQCAALGFT